VTQKTQKRDSKNLAIFIRKISAEFLGNLKCKGLNMPPNIYRISSKVWVSHHPIMAYQTN